MAAISLLLISVEPGFGGYNVGGSLAQWDPSNQINWKIDGVDNTTFGTTFRRSIRAACQASQVWYCR